MMHRSSKIKVWRSVMSVTSKTIPDSQIRSEHPYLTDKKNKYHQFRRPLWLKVRNEDKSKGEMKYPTRS